MVLTEILLYILISNFLLTQSNSDWWLNDAIKKSETIEPLPQHLLLIKKISLPFLHEHLHNSNTLKKWTQKLKTKNTDELIFSDKIYDTWQDTTTIKHEETATKTEVNKIITENQPTKTIQNASYTEDVCTYMKETICHKRSGFVYTTKSEKSIQSINIFIVCCILSSPVENNLNKIPDSIKTDVIRNKRSNKEVLPLNQREFLMRNKFVNKNSQATATTTKIISPDDDSIDPYWNVKSSTKDSLTKEENYDDYVEDYVVELPSPGLVGIYSEYENKPPSWTIENPNPPYNADVYSEEDDNTSFGYSTIDPRRVSKPQNRRRPITTEQPEEDTTVDVERQTIHFHSNPNFHVLQGFKLLNLGRTKSKYYSRRSSTESNIGNDSNERVDEQVYRNCGKTYKNSETQNRDKKLSEAETGSHPWLAVVVLSRRPRNVLCYSTIIHPRMAVTAGDCVSDYTTRTSAKDALAVITGLEDINERSETQNRIVMIKLHPQWRREILSNNLAILHWARPLRFNSKVQPACLSSFHDEEECKFYGWGGFDQAMRQRSRWQKASVVPAHDCRNNFAKVIALPSEAFCATVQSRGIVVWTELIV
ncbi:unnamed protein product [Diatraea saccharalis]|uniref:Peptidase S1 domain-containing protein n=1 Tax=Diatraea saccharalis TaxID=40085 RepID=A0A9N9WEA6_9NEOP|nr:unnamed protein product [Diatraea saccharalis]